MPRRERSLDLVRAQIAQSEAMLAQTGKLRQLGQIVAPISGVVTGALSAGMPVNEASAILTIAQIDFLKLVGAVPAKFSKLIHERHDRRRFRPGKRPAGD